MALERKQWRGFNLVSVISSRCPETKRRTAPLLHPEAHLSRGEHSWSLASLFLK